MFIHGGGSASYEIEKSLRCRGAASAYLSRTPSASNRTTWTYSAWVKKAQINTANYLLSTTYNYAANGNAFLMNFNSDQLLIRDFTSSANVWGLTTSMLFRDPSAWYHIVLAYDTTQATAADRVKLYVNGIQITAFSSSSYPTLNYQGYINSAVAHYQGGLVGTGGGPGQFFDGNLSEINFIDGQALTPASFGQTDPITSAWVPKAFTGTYGTNGFILGFDDGTNTTTLGNDQSGNNNDWTLSNVSLTAGVTYDWMSDTPTNNFPVINPLANAIAPVAGNQQMSSSSANYGGACSMMLAQGKWYWEYVQISGTAFLAAGITTAGLSQSSPFWSLAGGYAYYISTGQKYSNGSPAAYGAAAAVGDIIGVAFDATAGTLEFFKNNVSQGVAFTGLTQGNYIPAIGTGSNVAHNHAINFGQRPFSYTPPSGYKALCTQNLPSVAIPRGDASFYAKTRTGTGAAANVTGLRFQPDLAWIKCRNTAYDHILVDAVRGVGNSISPNTTGAQVSNIQTVSAFNSDGITVGTNVGVNENAKTYIDWMWKESVTAGLDIVTYTGTLATTGTMSVSHGLGVVPGLIISKSLNNSGVDAGGWAIWHQSLAANKVLRFDTAVPFDTVTSSGGTLTAPTSSLFYRTYNSGLGVTGNNYVAYVFAEVAGFSKFGFYTGNGSADGTFAYCGFRPRFVMIKRTDAVTNWYIYDTARDTYNQVGLELYPNLANAEANNTRGLDSLSNGFKTRTTSAETNASGGTYIYAAFAELPFKYANAR